MAKKKRRNNNTEGVVRIRLPEEGEMLGQVIQLLGNRLLLVRCIDGVTRQVMISGKHKRRMWVNQGDVITLSVHYGMDEGRGTMTYRYKAKGARQLHERGLISDETMLLYGMSGDLPDRSSYFALSEEERQFIWVERMERRFGPNWRERFERGRFRLPPLLQRRIEQMGLHNWLKEGF